LQSFTLRSLRCQNGSTFFYFLFLLRNLAFGCSVDCFKMFAFYNNASCEYIVMFSYTWISERHVVVATEVHTSDMFVFNLITLSVIHVV
jgi:hypothetical protein